MVVEGRDPGRLCSGYASGRHAISGSTECSLGGGRDTHISARTLAPPLGLPGFLRGEGGGSSGRF